MNPNETDPTERINFALNQLENLEGKIEGIRVKHQQFSTHLANIEAELRLDPRHQFNSSHWRNIDMVYPRSTSRPGLLVVNQPQASLIGTVRVCQDTLYGHTCI